MSVGRIKDLPYPEKKFESYDDAWEYCKELRNSLQEDQSERIEDFDWLKIDNKPWVDVREYGAKGDGVTDDTTAIQAALDSKDDNLTVLLTPDSNYSTSAMILMDGNNKHLIGYGATITLAANSDCHMVRTVRPNTDQSIEGIIFDGNGTNQGAGDFNIFVTSGGTGEPARLEIIKCQFINADNMAINLESPTEGLVDHCDFDNSGYGHMRWHAGDRTTISNCTFDCTDVDYSYMAISIDGHENTVENCIFNRIPASKPAIRIVPDGTNPVWNNKITSCSFLGNYDTVAGQIGISFDTTTYALDNIISNNSFSKLATGINASGIRTTVTGNHFISGGIPWYPSGADLDISFINNTIFACDKLRIKFTNGKISDNTFKSLSGSAIQLEGVTGVIVSNNIFRNIGTGADDGFHVITLELENATHSTLNIISGNICSSDDANLPNTFVTGTGTPINNKIENNIIQNVNGYIEGLAAATNHIKNNIGYKTENSGLSAAIATGATIAHGLVTTPTFVSVTGVTAGATDITISANATNITVTFGGGGNKTFYWSAKIR